jgi:FkbH-like protein
VWNLLGRLRDLFGKPELMEEDRLRQSSIRVSAQVREMAADGGSAEFLRTLEGTVTLAWQVDKADKRPLELINKTNQFNLNGLRMGESEWQRLLERNDTIVAVVSYQDKFGPLGKIAVLVGSQAGRKVKVSHWVMSCRAFSRRVEHHMLDSLFRHCDAEEIAFAFAKTEKNQPLREFFAAAGIRSSDDGAWRISRKDFLSSCGVLPHATPDEA